MYALRHTSYCWCIDRYMKSCGGRVVIAPCNIWPHSRKTTDPYSMVSFYFPPSILMPLTKLSHLARLHLSAAPHQGLPVSEITREGCCLHKQEKLILCYSQIRGSRSCL